MRLSAIDLSLGEEEHKLGMNICVVTIYVYSIGVCLRYGLTYLLWQLSRRVLLLMAHLECGLLLLLLLVLKVLRLLRRLWRRGGGARDVCVTMRRLTLMMVVLVLMMVAHQRRRTIGGS